MLVSKEKKVALVGTPNVGKSAIFNRLTGAYVTVSNYPGTTVEVSRGTLTAIKNKKVQVVDTPGMYSLIPISEEEKVARDLLIYEKPDVVVHVVDAKNLRRMLPLTLQLMEAGFHVILVLNIIDEADVLGIEINDAILSEKLGIPVLSVSAALNKGIDKLLKVLEENLR